jgi:hypothetical protein
VGCCTEINDRHGTGLLLQYLFEDFSRLATIGTLSCYDGERVRSAVHRQLLRPRLPRHEVYQAVLDWFRHAPPRQAYIAPFLPNDLCIAAALKDIFGTAVCLHVMDDNNLYGGEIPDALMAEALAKADLRLAISPELRSAYQDRYGERFWLLPPVVPDELVWRGPHELPNAQGRGVLVGNVWSQTWLDLLRRTVRHSGMEVDWFSSNTRPQWLKVTAEELRKDGIFVRTPLPAIELVRELRGRPFALAPSGQMNMEASRPNIAMLSLPSRLPFLAATARLPAVVLGSGETAAARFVERFGVGGVVPYCGRAFAEAVARITAGPTRHAIQTRAAEIGPAFSAKDIGEWVWQSLSLCRAADDRFETLFSEDCMARAA